MRYWVTLRTDAPGLAIMLGGSGPLSRRTSSSLHSYFLDAADEDAAVAESKRRHSQWYPEEKILGVADIEQHVWYDVVFRSRADGRKRHEVSILVRPRALAEATGRKRRAETIEEFLGRKVRSNSRIEWETKRDFGEVVRWEVSKKQ